VDQGPMSSAEAKKPSWRLAAPHDKRTQGLVVSGFEHLPVGRALFVQFGWDGVRSQGGGAWLKALNDSAPITDADGRDERCAAIALTYEGLRKMGLDAEALASFDRPFTEGMFQEDRLRRLGDRESGAWLETVISGGPIWSGNTPLTPAAAEAGAHAQPSERVETPVTVHALILLYEKDEASVEAWRTVVTQTVQGHGANIVRELEFNLAPEADGQVHEHFGFTDGVSQPIPFDAKGAVTLSTGAVAQKDEWNGLQLGEFLFGFENAHNEVAPGPTVSDSAIGKAAGLRAQEGNEGFLDLGANGSYMVVRELQQDVASFWRSMDQAAVKINSDPPGGKAVDADWVANRVIGRDREGNLLCPHDTVLQRDQYGYPNNDFAFFDRDPDGYGCPLGSHVRRGNPRDGLAPTAEDKGTLLAAANSHRILRRGRKFGKKIPDPRVDDQARRGLLFVCLNTDIGRQFEFVQKTWILNPNFSTLFDETDPLVGPKCNFTIPEEPLRRVIPVETFIQMAGGEYFFLPSLPALRYLEAL